MLKYHGTPITPRYILDLLAPNCFCVSFAEPRDADHLLRIAMSIMYDNGAWTAHSKGRRFDMTAYVRWLEGRLYQPHWAVVPDSIAGGVEENRRLERDWPLPRELSAIVYHFGEPRDRLREVLQSGYGRVAIGGSVGSREPGSEGWVRELDEIWDVITKVGGHPVVHMMRALNESSIGRWPFASADSASFARNHNEYGSDKFDRLHEINKKNPVLVSAGQPELWG